MSQQKLTLEQANELFNQLGAQVVVVAEAEEGAEEPNYEELVSAIRPEQEAGDPVDVEAHVGRAIGKQLGAMRSLLAQHFGIKRADIDGLDIKDMVPKLKSMLDGRYTQTESSLREQLEERNAEYNALEEKLTGEWQARLDRMQDEFDEHAIKDRFVTLLNGIPRSGGDVMKQAEMMVREAKSQYNVKINPVTKKVEFYDKANPEQKVMEGKNPLSDDAFGNTFVDGLGIRVTDTRHIPPTQTPQPSGVVHTQEPAVEKTAAELYKEKLQAQLEQ